MAMARARSTSSPSFCCSSIRRSRAFSTSLAVRAAMKSILPSGLGNPCSRSVSATAPTAACGTGRKLGACAATLLRRVGGGRTTLVGFAGVDRAIGMQHQPAGQPRLRHRAAGDPGVRGVLPLGHPLAFIETSAVRQKAMIQILTCMSAPHRP